MTAAAQGRTPDARDTLVARLGQALRAADAVAANGGAANGGAAGGGRPSGAAGWADADLEPMPDKGLAHDHVRLAGRGIVARLPKQSQMGLGAAANLAYQAACYTRASASGHAPRLIATLAPGAALPRGGLLVEEIAGHPARLPGDLPAIATALGRIHALPLPPAPARPPLADPADPLALL
ncbi:MAG: hypothetical protein RQ752_07280, partial [Thermohalobaculum sp.]|nr:hypothetical protein [Thermohalobaculum sp.]